MMALTPAEPALRDERGRRGMAQRAGLSRDAPRVPGHRGASTIRRVLAARLHELGGRLQVEQSDEPVAGEGQALVELAAASIDPVDVATAEGRHYSGGPQL